MYSTWEDAFWGWFTIINLAIIYVFPSIFAFMNRRRARGAILIINLFFGWTLMGWAGALAWAAIPDRKGP